MNKNTPDFNPMEEIQKRDKEIEELKKYKVHYDRLFEASVVVKTEEYSKMVDTIAKLRAVVEDFKNHGTRHDPNPTGMFLECGCFQSMNKDSWQGYIKSMDEGVRKRARAVLEELDNENK